MPDYIIKYEINTKYEMPVKKAFIQILTLPVNNNLQQVTDYYVKSNLKKSQYISRNIFGFKLLQYTTQRSIDHFHFELKAHINVPLQNPFDFITSSGKDEWDVINSHDFYIDKIMFLRNTPLTKLNKDFISEIIPSSENIDLFTWLLELNNNIHLYIKYSPNTTSIHTNAQEVYDIRKGVCQDYAHLFIAIARLFNIPCRYVSGYLNQDNIHTRSGQTHAWVEALLPFNGWIGFDPTNNLLIDHHYIKIAHGTDYNDCSPITGFIETPGKQINEHYVQVINQ